MTTIIVTHENNEMEEFDFDVEIKTITIGRRSTNDVCVPHLSVSGNHCRVLVSETGTLIEDLNSTNGTYINGRLISKQGLNDGDDIVIGKAKLTFQQPGAAGSMNTQQDIARDKPRDQAQQASGIESEQTVAEIDERPQTLAEKAALHKQQVEQGHVAAESEFAGDYCEPDDSEIAAMVESSDLAKTHQKEAKTVQKVTPLPDSASVAAGAVATGAAGVAAAGVAKTAGGLSTQAADVTHSLDSANENENSGAIIEIKNGAKSGQVLPIDKPVTTLGRPGIQIAAIMKKPEGYFLMHIESEDQTDRPRLNDSMIGDDPVLLSSGDSLNVAGIDVQFMLS